MSTGITVFVVALVVINILACLWLIWWTSKKEPGEAVDGEVKSHVWDGDLQELNNPLPRWWLNLFLLTIVFAFAYLALYPGLGSFAGTLGWSQENQHDERLAQVQAKLEAHYAQFAEREVADLAADPAAARVGGRLFADNCAGCHGPSAQGASGFPNLTDSDWLYGGEVAQITHSIRHGRSGIMPPFGSMLDENALDGLVGLLSNWKEPPLDAEAEKAARAKFATVCAACHGADAKGNPALGAPNLSDDIWLYGGDPEQIRHTLQWGRQGRMPAHKDLVSDIEIQLLSAYVLRISGQTQ